MDLAGGETHARSHFALSLFLSERRRARDAVAAAAAAPSNGIITEAYDDDDEAGPAPSPFDAALDALTAKQAAVRSRGLAALYALLRSGFVPDAAARPLTTISALRAVLGKRGGSGSDAALAASCVALAFLQTGPGADATAAFEAIAPVLAGLAGSVKGGGPAARAAACSALAVGAFTVGDVGGAEVAEAAEALAGAAASRVVMAAGEAGSAAPASAVAAAALRGLALLATASWPSQAAALAGDGRVLRALSGALACGDVDVRHAAGLAAVALRGNDADDDEESDEDEEAKPLSALAPALARVRGLASSSHAALDRLGGSVPGSGAATPTGSGAAAAPTSTAFRSSAGLRLSRAARTEQRRLFRGLEGVGGGTTDVRATVLKKVAGPGWGELCEEGGWLAALFGCGKGGGWNVGGQAVSAREREKARAKGRAGAARERVGCLLEDGEW